MLAYFLPSAQSSLFIVMSSKTRKRLTLPCPTDRGTHKLRKSLYKRNSQHLKTNSSLPGCFQMVFSSSCTVYGNPTKVPIDESHPLKALSPYGRSKLIIEDMFRDVAAAEPEWRTILLRYFNPVGAHPSGNCWEPGMD